MEYFSSNLEFLRKQKGFTQAETADYTGIERTTWSNYERGKSFPKLEDFIHIAKIFGITETELLHFDFKNVALNEKAGNLKTGKNVALNVAPTVALNAPKETNQKELRINVVAEPDAEYGGKNAVIPITDISVAAGAGWYNGDHIDNVESLRMPVQFLKRNATYICVKIKGISMSPTMQDGGYVVIRQLNQSEWAEMPNERIFVVSDKDGKSYLKRVKNRFKQGFIVLRSDSPDKATFPTFNLQLEDINTIWYVEWYFSAKMPNIHDQYYTRLEQLEDKVDELLNARPKIEP